MTRWAANLLGGAATVLWPSPSPVRRRLGWRDLDRSLDVEFRQDAEAVVRDVNAAVASVYGEVDGVEPNPIVTSLPSPELLAAYDRARPGLRPTLLAETVAASARRRRDEMRSLREDFARREEDRRQRRIGQLCAVVLGVAASFGTVAVVAEIRPVVLTAIITATGVAFIGFVSTRWSDGAGRRH